jgi:hypothetical protein
VGHGAALRAQETGLEGLVLRSTRFRTGSEIPGPGPPFAASSGLRSLSFVGYRWKPGVPRPSQVGRLHLDDAAHGSWEVPPGVNSGTSESGPLFIRSLQVEDVYQPRDL